MKFVLVRSNTFIRIARKIFKKKPEIIQNVQNTLRIISN
jgi:hypothetical protein